MNEEEAIKDLFGLTPEAPEVEKSSLGKAFEAVEPTIKTLSPTYKFLTEGEKLLKDIGIVDEAPTETDEFEAIKMFGRLGEPTFSEKAEQFKYGLLEEGPKSVASLKLGAEAFKLGSKLPGTAGVVGGTILGLGGLGAGYFLTDEAYNFSKKYAKENFDYDLLPTPIRQKLIPYRAGGESTGRLIAGYPAAFMLPKGVANRFGKYLENTREYAYKNPLGFFVTEAPAPLVAGAAVTGFSLSAEDYELTPGKKALVETGATLVVPTQLVVRGALTLKNLLTNLINQENLGQKEASAATKIIDIIEQNSESPDKVLRLLEEETKLGEKVNLTGPQKTGSFALSRLAKNIARMSPKFANDSRKSAEKSFEQMEKLVNAFAKIAGDRQDPNLIKVAADLRIRTLKDFLEMRVSAGEQKAADAISKLGNYSTEVSTKIGEIIKQNVIDSLSDARELEKKIWTDAYASAYRKYLSGTPQDYSLFGKTQKIKVEALKKRPRKMVLDYLDFASNLSKRQYREDFKAIRSFMEEEIGVTDEMVNKYKSGMLTEEYLDSLKETGKGRIPANFLPATKNIKEVDVPELIKIRSEYLDLSRKAISNTIDFGDARFFGKQASSILEDLSEIDNPAYQAAREYSRVLNDVFSRSYAKDLTGFKTGMEERIPAEILVSKALGAGSDTNSLRMEQIQNTAKFLLDKEGYSENARQRLASINDAYKQVYKLGATKFRDPETGQINTKRLSRFVSDNKTALQKLNILEDFENIERTSNAFQAIQNKQSSINKRLLQQRDFAKVLQYDSSVSPVSLINEVMTSSKPLQRLNDLYITAKRSGPSSVNGLKSLVLDYSFKNASDSKNNFNPYLFYEKFFTKRGDKTVSDFDIMRRIGLLTKEEGDNLKKLIIPMMRVQRSIALEGNVENFMDESSALTEFVLRSTGSKMGQKVFGSSLIAQSAGSKYIRNIFDKMPKLLTYQFIEDAMRNPELLAAFLKKGKSSKEMVEVARTFHSALQGIGLGYYISEIEEPVEEIIDKTREFIPFSSSSLPKKGPPNRGLNVSPSQKVSMDQSPRKSSNSKQMLQSLFPLDPVLGVGRPPSA